MELGAIVDGVRSRERTLTVFNADEAVVEELAATLADRAVTVRAEETTSGRPEGFCVLELDGLVLTTVEVSELRTLLESVRGPETGAETDADGRRRSRRRRDRRRGGGTPGHSTLVEHLSSTTFTSYDRSSMRAASHEIEDRALRVGSGRLVAGFQELSRFEDRREAYERLATAGVDVTVFGEPDVDADPPTAVRVEPTSRDAVRHHWFVVFDGGDEPDQATALLAREEADGFYGFWTYETDVVEQILDYLDDLDQGR